MWPKPEVMETKTHKVVELVRSSRTCPRLGLRDTHIAQRLRSVDPLRNGTYRSVATSRDPSDNPVAKRLRARCTSGNCGAVGRGSRVLALGRTVARSLGVRSGSCVAKSRCLLIGRSTCLGGRVSELKPGGCHFRA